jgi:hypothetical protein
MIEEAGAFPPINLYLKNWKDARRKGSGWWQLQLLCERYKLYYSARSYCTAAGRKKKKRKTQNEVGKGSEKNGKTEESNTIRCSELTNTVKSDGEPVPGVTLENSYQQTEKHFCQTTYNGYT